MITAGGHPALERHEERHAVMAISLEKLATTAPTLVSLAKGAQVRLHRQGLSGHRAKVALCLDHSGSMRRLYSSGLVQRLAERVLALATQIDDDGAIDVFAFGTTGSYLGELTVADFAGGVDRLTLRMRYGTTNYAGVMELVRTHYRGTVLPAYVMFVTDGAPDSKSKASRQIVDASREPLFWQFMGVGGGPFDYLRRLDESVGGRLVDNANFFEVPDLALLPDDALYAAMLAEYPSWLVAARAAGLLGS